MQVELLIHGSSDPRARYVGWSLSPCSLRLTDATGTAGPPSLTIRNRASASGGQLEFRAARNVPAQRTLQVTLPLDGSPVEFFTSGVFGRSSKSDGDTAIEVVSQNNVLASLPLMVRVRKDASKLSVDERNRFLSALFRLNDRGLGLFQVFRQMHGETAYWEAHQSSAFLPWHRAYLLDLERALQALDPSVALPYWRFNERADTLFTPDFLGADDGSGNAVFASSNPLALWTVDGYTGVDRTPLFDVMTRAAPVANELATLGLGPRYRAFKGMEVQPHNATHGSFGGSLSNPDWAPRDPLFFLLHCNVDRLWAMWQLNEGRYDRTDASAYDPAPPRPGHNLADTMWPWDGRASPPSPTGGLTPSLVSAAPGAQPRVEQMLDYQGVVAQASRLGYDYDDVPLGLG